MRSGLTRAGARRAIQERRIRLFALDAYRIESADANRQGALAAVPQEHPPDRRRAREPRD
mgnify:CR=1 FL=1